MAPTKFWRSSISASYRLVGLGVGAGWLSAARKACAIRSWKEQQRVRLCASSEHALFGRQSSSGCLGLVIIDGRHRFGVGQRLALRMKGGDEEVIPHQLMMSAT
ncbi:MAG: ATP-dependent DNA helicase RecG, partial [Nitrosomonas sp.]|nr:ATP-dependent DNA helicase RecG [Nitrosomonas sp.]